MTLESGIPVLIDSGITAPAAGNTFTIEPSPPGRDFSIIFAVITGTTVSADLQASLDGGTTWDLVTAAILTAVPSGGVGPAGSAKVVTPIVAGPLYRLNYTTATGTIAVRACKN